MLHKRFGTRKIVSAFALTLFFLLSPFLILDTNAQQELPPPIPPENPTFLTQPQDPPSPMVVAQDEPPIINRASNRTNLAFGVGDKIPEMTVKRLFLPFVTQNSATAQSAGQRTAALQGDCQGARRARQACCSDKRSTRC